MDSFSADFLTTDKAIATNLIRISSELNPTQIVKVRDKNGRGLGHVTCRDYVIT